MRLWTKKQPSFPDRRWMEALPLGNGITSALIYGNVGKETLLINRFDRWEGKDAEHLPDVSEHFKKMKEKIKNGEYGETNFILCNALRDNGYDPIYPPVPSVPYSLTLTFNCTVPFSKYSRGIDIDRGEAFVRYNEGEATLKRRAFVSMADDLIMLECTSDKSFSVKLEKFDALNCKVTTDGKKTELDKYILIEDAKSLLIAVSFGEIPDSGYDELFERHLTLWKKAMGDETLSLNIDTDRHNEALIEDNNDNGISSELVQKLWYWGRYLFVSGTSENGYPFPLYGLWCGEENPTWAQNVANENVQIIYHHTAVGGLIRLVKPLIHYYYRQMDKCREAARKLFGCRGIFVSVYSTPISAYPSPNVPVIINYISSAAWLCRHFWEYYVYTKDEELLQSKILPFMLETAEFFEDYIIRENGRVKIIPSVSPENTPKNLIDITNAHKVGLTHPNPAVKDSTMDHALLKELLTNLITCAETHSINERRVSLWQEILSEIPEYRVNDDGAVAEWVSEELEDFYLHRHLSHIYPLFPGDEIGGDSPLLPAFARACDLRELGGFAGWTYPHMSAIYSRLGRAEDAIGMLDGLVKYCLTENFFSLGVDYCDRGSWTAGVFPAIIQLDGIMGAVGAIQEMLFRVKGNELYILPALPNVLNKGCIKNWHYPEGTVDIEWNRSEGIINVTLHGEKSYKLIYPKWKR